METEKEFYYSKLNEIESLCNEYKRENLQIVNRTLEILYRGTAVAVDGSQSEHIESLTCSGSDTEDNEELIQKDDENRNSIFSLMSDRDLDGQDAF